MSEQPLRRPSFFEPAAGAAILAADWLCFGLEWPLGPLGMAFVSVFSFVGVTVLVTQTQRRAGDHPRVAFAKGIFGGIAAGLPFPIAGTILGALILMLSGLRRR